MEAIDLSKFCTADPYRPKRLVCAFSVTPENIIRLNRKLAESIQSSLVYVHVQEDARIILLEETNDENNPKAGKIHHNREIPMKNLLELLGKGGVPAPAWYEADWYEPLKMWLCKYDEDHRFPTKSAKKRIQKPRKTDLKEMLPKQVQDALEMRER